MIAYRFASVLFSIACVSMVLIGLSGYSGFDVCFHKTASFEGKMLYNHYYFVPYVVLSGVFLIYALVGFNTVLRIWLSSVCLGASVFGYIFIPVSGAGHDFGHVLYGGCFESARLDALINSINVYLILFSFFLVILGIREYRKKKIPSTPSSI